MAQKNFHPLVVANSLQRVAKHFHIEIAQRQPGQFGQKVPNQGDIQRRADMEQNPAAQKVHQRPAGDQHELSQQDQAQQADVTGHYSPVHDLLRQQRQQQLDAAAQQQGQQQLRQPSAVGTQIGKQPADAGGRWLSSKRASKVGGGFQ